MTTKPPQEERPKDLTMYARKNLREEFLSRLVGQDAAVEQIIPYVTMFGAGLHQSERPAGVFMLLGPTGTGKTKTVETLAEILHGHDDRLIKIDCGEYQNGHEIAKLIGSPPGYLGHRETQPYLTPEKITAMASEKSNLTLILFDEIEKADQALFRILLGVLDKGKLKLGDNRETFFKNTMIFFTSNLGARKMQDLLVPTMGFTNPERRVTHTQLKGATEAAVRRRFSPEFVNRIDEMITYNPLTIKHMEPILELGLNQIRKGLETTCIGYQAGVVLLVVDSGKAWLLKHGFSEVYGARYLNRTLQRHIMNPIADLVVEGGGTKVGSRLIRVSAKDDKLILSPVTLKRKEEKPELEIVADEK